MRGSVAEAPYFLETISCLTWILGESSNSGRNLGWTGVGKKRTIPNEFRESLGADRRIEIRTDSRRFRLTMVAMIKNRNPRHIVRWSGLPDACLERAGLREDKDLHCEAWVLVTQATDTLTGLQAKIRSKCREQWRVWLPPSIVRSLFGSRFGHL
jgi:hypothetical protein